MKRSPTAYSEGLVTPRPGIVEQDPEIRVTPLLDSQRLRRIAAVYNGSDKTYDDITEAVSEISHLVRHSLQFRPLGKSDRNFSPDTIRQTPETNCYGMTIVASELMERIGINHTISFANTHSFITVADSASKAIFMADPSEKEFCLDISESLMGEAIDDQLNNSPVATNILETETLLGLSKRRLTREAMIALHPWLTFENPRGVWLNEQHNPRDTQLILRSYRGELGRDVLEAYMRTRIFTSTGELGSATHEAMRLTGIYPEIDHRNNQGIVGKLVQKLIASGRFDELAELVEVYTSSVSENEARHQIFSIDTVRKMGTAALNADIVNSTVEAYRKLGGPLAEGKALKAERIAAHLSGEKL